MGHSDILHLVKEQEEKEGSPGRPEGEKIGGTPAPRSFSLEGGIQVHAPVSVPPELGGHVTAVVDHIKVPEDLQKQGVNSAEVSDFQEPTTVSFKELKKNRKKRMKKLRRLLNIKESSSWGLLQEEVNQDRDETLKELEEELAA